MLSEVCIDLSTQDPTEQTAIDNFMVQQLDGTVNEWGWCKQKVIYQNAFVQFDILGIDDLQKTINFGFSAWSKCYTGGVSCCLQSWG